MIGFAFYLSLMLVVFAALMFIRVKFDVNYRRDGSDDHLNVEMTALKGLIRYKTEVPVVELDKFFLNPVLKMEADIQSIVYHPIEGKGLLVSMPLPLLLRKLPAFIKQGCAYLKTYNQALKKFLRSVRCHELKWTTELGLGDPAYTGIATGLIWGVKGVLYRVFSSNVGQMVRPPAFQVLPSFNVTGLRLDFRCIFDIRIGHIIIAGLKFVKLRLKLSTRHKEE